jgi:hypothetical protein
MECSRVEYRQACSHLPLTLGLAFASEAILQEQTFAGTETIFMKLAFFIRNFVSLSDSSTGSGASGKQKDGTNMP